MTNEYVQIPTADFDEQEELQQVSLKRQNQNLQTLEESLYRVGQMSLKISSEIEMQNLYTKDLEEEREEMEQYNESLDTQSRTATSRQWYTECLVCVVIISTIILLLIAIAMKIINKRY